LTPATFPINCEKSRLFILIRGRAEGSEIRKDKKLKSLKTTRREPLAFGEGVSHRLTGEAYSRKQSFISFIYRRLFHRTTSAVRLPIIPFKNK
ncbi:MAG: hypothetical protein IKW18_03875, partial [Clostridia bacterium]|nr:hypothetical protein [Clostridia bacterium]